MTRGRGYTLHDAHHRLVEAKRLERRECPKCGTPLAREWIEGGSEAVSCPEQYCEYETTLERNR